MSDVDVETILAFDFKLGRPGCVLLQAAMGGDRNVVMKIDSKYWLLHPTPDMKLYKLTGQQVGHLIKKFDGHPKR